VSLVDCFQSFVCTFRWLAELFELMMCHSPSGEFAGRTRLCQALLLCPTRSVRAIPIP
jgi:hypothetical protein